jgi:hypothetical protein
MRQQENMTQETNMHAQEAREIEQHLFANRTIEGRVQTAEAF